MKADLLDSVAVAASHEPPALRQPATLLDRMARRFVLAQLPRLRYGTVSLTDESQAAGDEQTFGDGRGHDALHARVTVHDPSFYGDVALGGTIGAGEAFMAGHWSCDDLTSLVRLLIRNRQVLENMEGMATRWRLPLERLLQRWRRNSRDGSRRNISAHYDLGNDFFAAFLDETLMYSCGIFERVDSTLAEASAAKNDRICRKLQLGPRDHLLEIGTGWGGFALHAAGQYGCRVTTTTISPAQFEVATQRIQQAGLADRVSVLLKDYRDLDGQYDKLVSIEMVEAVGEAFLDGYFAACDRLLKPHGQMLLQAITIAERQFDAYRRSVDFIQRHVFPGGFLPSVGRICQALGRGTDLRLSQLEDLTPHYARTLRAWRGRFRENLAEIRAMGYPETLLRMWEFYLCYCEAAFEENSAGCVQMLLSKPACRREPLLPKLA